MRLHATILSLVTGGNAVSEARISHRAQILRVLYLSVVFLLVSSTVLIRLPSLRSYTPGTGGEPSLARRPYTPAEIPRTFEGFTTANCSNPERYRALQSKHNIKFVTAKFGHAEKFKDEILQRRQEAITTFEWLNEENAIGLYSVPDQWRKEFPNHTQFLDDPDHESATGGGWWFWKPVVILEQLETLQDGDFLFYADNDQTPWWSTISDFLSFMLDHPEYDWALPRWYGGTEYGYTKKDVFVAHCASTVADKEQRRKSFHSGQWEAGIHIIRNSARTRQLARQWKALATDYHAISDEPSYLRNHEGFAEHRRDQSLLNMVIKCSFRVGLLYTNIPHSCGWLFGQYMIDFKFLVLPDVTDNYLITLQNNAAYRWSVFQTIKEINGF